MARYTYISSDTWTSDEEATEEYGLVALTFAPTRPTPARSKTPLCCIVACATGALLMVVTFVVAVGSSIERAISECERSSSCIARSGHLDQVLMLKQNTMQPSDCPTGYTGTMSNINGNGKQWSFGDMDACASTCNAREGCKAFEFHDKNGRCGTYLDGYSLAGKQQYRWLTCVKEEVPPVGSTTMEGSTTTSGTTGEITKPEHRSTTSESTTGKTTKPESPSTTSKGTSGETTKLEHFSTTSDGTTGETSKPKQLSTTSEGTTGKTSKLEHRSTTAEGTAGETTEPEHRSTTREGITGETTEPEHHSTTSEGLTGKTTEPRESALKHRHRALALGGGGFLAYASFAGLASGLLATSSSQGMPYATNFVDLLRSFGIVAGVNGGAWFQLQFVYSETFEDLLNKLASLARAGSIQDAVALFNKAVGDSLFSGDYSKFDDESLKCMLATAILVDQSLQNETNHANERIAATSEDATEEEKEEIRRQVVQDLQRKAGEKGIPELHQTLAVELLVLLTENDGIVTWNTIIDTFFERVAKIKRGATLGATAINTWAEDKLMIWGATVPTPTAASGSLGHIYIDLEQEVNLSYAVVPDGLGVDMFPARFSYTLSSSTDERSPATAMPFCARPDCFQTTLAYSSVPRSAVPDMPRLDTQCQAVFERAASSLPVSSVAAVSSASMWRQGLLEGFDATSQCLDLAVWADNTSFSSAAKLRADLVGSVTVDNVDERIQELANAGLLALADGSDTDHLGIAAAVAANATIITAWMQVDVTNMSQDQAYWQLTSLFKRGRSSSVRRIFMSPEGNAVDQDIHGFGRIPAPEGAKFLEAIAYGTIECVTADNEWQGIKAGRPIIVNILAIEVHDLTSGFVETGYNFSSYHDYGVLVGEVLDALTSPDNSDEVKAIIDRFVNPMMKLEFT